MSARTSSRSATRNSTVGEASVSPSALAAATTGVSSDHSAIRDACGRSRGRLDGHVHAAGARRHLGERGVGGTHGEQPAPAPGRLGGEAERPGGPAGHRHRDQHVQRSHPAGQRRPAADGDRHRRTAAGEQREHVTDDGGSPETRHHDRTWAAVHGDRVEPGLGGGGQGDPHLGAGPGERAQAARGVGSGQRVGVVEQLLVEAHSFAHSRVRASSTSSTGMPSSIR